jgi:hypothetical protein
MPRFFSTKNFLQLSPWRKLKIFNQVVYGDCTTISLELRAYILNLLSCLEECIPRVITRSTVSLSWSLSWYPFTQKLGECVELTSWMSI